MTEAPPAPPSTEQKPDLAQSVFNPNPDAPKSTPESSTAAPPPPKDSTQQTQAKPGEEPKRKSGLEKVGGIKKPETPPENLPPAKPSAEDNMKILRQAKEEWDKVKPEYEKTKTEYEATKQELAKLKAMGLTPQEREEFSRYRDLHAVEAVRSSAEFKNTVVAPIQARVAKIKQQAVNAKLDGAATAELLDACDIEDEYQRNKAIRNAFSKAELELEDFQTLSGIAAAAAKELQEVYYPKEDKIIAQAREIETAKRQQDSLQSSQSLKKQQEDFQKEQQRVYDILANDKLKLLMDDTDLSMDGMTLAEAMKNAAPAQTMEDRVFEVSSAAAMPFVIQWANKILAENHQLKQATRLRNGAAPRGGDGLPPKAAGDAGQGPTAEEVFGRKRG